MVANVPAQPRVSCSRLLADSALLQCVGICGLMVYAFVTLAGELLGIAEKFWHERLLRFVLLYLL